jgi:regulator of protease activity HflC (stomatin/prohibitin superfamily)
MNTLIVVVAVAVLVVLTLALAVQIVRQYEQGVVFRLRRSRARGCSRTELWCGRPDDEPDSTETDSDRGGGGRSPRPGRRTAR